MGTVSMPMLPTMVFFWIIMFLVILHLEWPKGTGVHSIFQSALWMGATVNGSRLEQLLEIIHKIWVQVHMGW